MVCSVLFRDGKRRLQGGGSRKVSAEKGLFTLKLGLLGGSVWVLQLCSEASSLHRSSLVTVAYLSTCGGGQYCLAPSESYEGQSVPGLLPSFRWFADSLWCPMPFTSGSASVSIWHSSCVCVSPSKVSLLIRTPVRLG